MYTKSEEAELETLLLQKINELRQENAAPMLKHHDFLYEVAHQHALDMATGKSKFGHYAFSNRHNLIKSNLKNVAKIGENLAFHKYEEEPEEKAFQLWMESTNHRKNLLYPKFTDSGLAVVQTLDKTYFFAHIMIHSF